MLRHKVCTVFQILMENCDEYDSEKNPVTAYASTKMEAEMYLTDMNSNSFSVCCFRPSTVFAQALV